MCGGYVQSNLILLPFSKNTFGYLFVITETIVPFMSTYSLFGSLFLVLGTIICGSPIPITNYIDLFTCIPNQPCIIHCGEGYCKNTIINASISSSLNIYCSTTTNKVNKTCQNTKIICPKNIKTSCTIHCEGPNSCLSTQIIAVNTDNVNVTCLCLS